MGFMDSYSQKVFRRVADSIGYDDGDERDDAAYWRVENRRVKCSMCGCYLFEPVELPSLAQVPSASAPAAPRPVALECSYCGHIELFSGKRPVEIEG